MPRRRRSSGRRSASPTRSISRPRQERMALLKRATAAAAQLRLPRWAGMIPSASTKGSVEPRARMERGRRSSTEAHGCNRGLHFCGPPFIEQQHSATSRHLALRTATSSVEASPYSGRRLRRACSRPRPSGRPGPPPPRLEAHLWAQRRKRVLRRSPGTPSHCRQLALRPHEATARSPRRSSWP